MRIYSHIVRTLTEDERNEKKNRNVLEQSTPNHSSHTFDAVGYNDWNFILVATINLYTTTLVNLHHGCHTNCLCAIFQWSQGP